MQIRADGEVVVEQTLKKEPRSYQDVKVFIGDNFYQPALVKIKDFNYGGNTTDELAEDEDAVDDYENANTSQNVPNFTEITPKHDYLLEKIQTWGPTYSVTFDLKLNEFQNDYGEPIDWTELLRLD